MIDITKLNETIVGGYKIAHGIEDNAVVQPVKRIKRPRHTTKDWADTITVPDDPSLDVPEPEPEYVLEDEE